MRLRRAKPEPQPHGEAKPYRVTIHAAEGQWHTFAMGPGDGVGVGAIRVSILADGTVDVWPIESYSEAGVTLRTPQTRIDVDAMVEAVRGKERKQMQRSGQPE